MSQSKEEKGEDVKIAINADEKTNNNNNKGGDTNKVVEVVKPKDNEN